MDGGGDEDEEWPDEDEEEEYKGGIDMDDIIITKNDKGYKAVKSDNIKHQVIARMSEIEDLYGLAVDELIILAQHYKWNGDNMQEWFNEDVQQRLKYQLGLEFQ